MDVVPQKDDRRGIPGCSSQIFNNEICVISFNYKSQKNQIDKNTL